VLLPCNVVVRRESGETRIAAIDPERMLSIVANDEVAPGGGRGEVTPRAGRRARGGASS
jgi:hypothetical protein